MTLEKGTALPSVRGGKGGALALPTEPVRKVRRRSRWKGRLVGMILMGSLGAGAYVYRVPLEKWAGSFVGGKQGDMGTEQVYTVKRGVLRVVITEDGKLKAVNNHVISLEVNGKIASLADAGARVKKGDVLVTIDPKPFEDSKRTEVGDRETARQTLVIAQKEVPIAESKADSDLAAAQTKCDEAKLALKLYTTLEVPKSLNDFETQINDTRTKLQDAQKKGKDNQVQLDEHLEDDDAKKDLQQQVDQSKQTILSFQKTQQTLEEQRKLFRAYSYPQNLKSKEQAWKNAELEVIKTKTSGENEIAQKKAEVEKDKELISRLDMDIARLDDFIAKCTVRAPAAGLIFYGAPDAERYYQPDQIRVGADWYSNYPIMTIPDLSAFKIDVALPEVYRGRVAIGQPARVVLEAVPGLVLTGKIESLASVARGKVPWDQNSPQVFDTTISLGQVDPRMVAGMSSRVEITTAVYDDVLFVPVEAVFDEDGKTVAYRERAGMLPEKVAVKVGAASDHYVLIAAGLGEGDRVLLSRPANFFVDREFLAKYAAVSAATLPAAESMPASMAASVPASAATNMAASAPSASGPATSGPATMGKRPATSSATLP